MPSATWTHHGERACVVAFRDEMIGFAAAHGVPEPKLGDLKLAVSEAATNAVTHAFLGLATPGRVTGTIDVDARAGRVTIVVSDDGIGLTPRPDSPGLGLGLPLIAAIAESIDLRAGAEGIGTELWMSFAFDAA